MAAMHGAVGSSSWAKSSLLAVNYVGLSILRILKVSLLGSNIVIKDITVYLS